MSSRLPEDLSVAARRGLLSEDEERLLERALAEDPELRAAHRVGVDLDRCTSMRSGDEALIGRAADAALCRVRTSGIAGVRRPARRRRSTTALLVAAGITITGAAAAVFPHVVPAHWFGAGETEPAPAPAPAPAQGTGTAAAVRIPNRAPQPAEEPEAKDVEEPAETPAEPAPRVRSATPPASAGALFSSANLARREGDFDRAKRLYSQLIARHPESDEARLAQVSLGKLLLTKGDPSEAKRHFDQYLKDGNGQLAEEALVSRAQSLQKLGRSDAERATWQRLLAEHPKSIYAPTAKARLKALRPGQ